MSTPTAVAQRFYDVIARADGQALFALLTDDFVATVSAGMPHGVGGEHRGPVDMITRVWGPIHLTLRRCTSTPVEYLAVDDNRVVVLGRYWGSARLTAKPPSTRRSPTSSPLRATASRRCTRSPTPPGGAFRRR